MDTDQSGDISSSGNRTQQVALFVTCLADIMRPSVARASLRLLEDAGFAVVVPRQQTCCGQPQYNSGDFASAAKLARRHIEIFEAFPYTVVPSGSCAGMLVRHYPRIVGDAWRERAEAFAAKVYELSTFLTAVAGYRPQARTAGGTVAYHDSCAGLRELGVRAQPRQLLGAAGIEIAELEGRDVCCGFGGTFCAKMPDISAKMADDKLRDVDKSGADTLVAGDLGCLLALSGRASRNAQELRFLHLAEVLAGGLEQPGIGEAEAS